MIPLYFKYKKNKDNTITLYHGMRDDSFEYFISNELLSPKASADAPKMLWLCSSRDEGTFTKNYRNIISIDVPISMFHNGKFTPVNSVDVATHQVLKIKDYKFRILKICGIDWEDTKENIYKVYNEELQKFIKHQTNKNPENLLYDLFDTDVIVGLVKNWMYMYENYTLKHKKWNYNEFDYNKNLIL